MKIGKLHHCYGYGAERSCRFHCTVIVAVRPLSDAAYTSQLTSMDSSENAICMRRSPQLPRSFHLAKL